jgi:hypothetical protein
VLLLQNRFPGGFNPLIGMNPGGAPRPSVPTVYKHAISEESEAQEGATSDAPSRMNDPYHLDAKEGSTVEASFPFNGDPSLLQLKFTIGDRYAVALYCLAS